MEKKEWTTMIAFGASLCALTTIMIPALSVILAVIGLVFYFLSRKTGHKGMVWAALGMSVLALILDSVYLLVVLSGRA